MALDPLAGLLNGPQDDPLEGLVQPAAPLGPPTPEELSRRYGNEFTKGLRRGALGMLGTTQAFGAQLLEPVAPKMADDLFEQARQTLDFNRGLRPKFEKFDAVTNVGSFVDYGLGKAGEALPSTALSLGAAGVGAGVGLGLRVLGARVISPMAASTAAGAASGFAPEAGEAALTMQDDPRVMQTSTPMERLGLSSLKGGVNAALEFVPERIALGRAFGSSPGKLGVRGALGEVGKGAAQGVVTEGLTEGAQEFVGQTVHGLANPERDQTGDLANIKEAAIGGAFGGVALGTAGGAVRGGRGLATNLEVPEAIKKPGLPTVYEADYETAKFIDKNSKRAADFISRSYSSLAKSVDKKIRGEASVGWTDAKQLLLDDLVSDDSPVKDTLAKLSPDQQKAVVGAYESMSTAPDLFTKRPELKQALTDAFGKDPAEVDAYFAEKTKVRGEKVAEENKRIDDAMKKISPAKKLELLETVKDPNAMQAAMVEAAKGVAAPQIEATRGDDVVGSDEETGVDIKGKPEDLFPTLDKPITLDMLRMSMQDRYWFRKDAAKGDKGTRAHLNLKATSETLKPSDILRLLDAPDRDETGKKSRRGFTEEEIALHDKGDYAEVAIRPFSLANEVLQSPKRENFPDDESHSKAVNEHYAGLAPLREGQGVNDNSRKGDLFMQAMATVIGNGMDITAEDGNVHHIDFDVEREGEDLPRNVVLGSVPKKGSKEGPYTVERYASDRPAWTPKTIEELNVERAVMRRYDGVSNKQIKVDAKKFNAARLKAKEDGNEDKYKELNTKYQALEAMRRRRNAIAAGHIKDMLIEAGMPPEEVGNHEKGIWGQATNEQKGIAFDRAMKEEKQATLTRNKRATVMDAMKSAYNLLEDTVFVSLDPNNVVELIDDLEEYLDTGEVSGAVQAFAKEAGMPLFTKEILESPSMAHRETGETPQDWLREKLEYMRDIAKQNMDQGVEIEATRSVPKTERTGTQGPASTAYGKEKVEVPTGTPLTPAPREPSSILMEPNKEKTTIDKLEGVPVLHTKPSKEEIAKPVEKTTVVSKSPAVTDDFGNIVRRDQRGKVVQVDANKPVQAPTPGSKMSEQQLEKLGNKPKEPPEPSLFEIEETNQTTYPQRTYRNAQETDATWAVAIDFGTAGEQLTARAAGDKLTQTNINLGVKKTAAQLLAHLKRLNAKSLNIAGNGIYSLSQHQQFKGLSEKELQDKYDAYVLAVLEIVHKEHPLSEIRSGGQTGADEAGAKAGIALGIRTKVLMPRGHLIKTTEGSKKQTREEAMARYGQNTENKPKEEKENTGDPLIDKLNKEHLPRKAGEVGTAENPIGVPMYYSMKTEQLREDLRAKYPKGTTTAELVRDGRRTATTRAPQSGVRVGDIIVIPRVPGRFRVTGFERVKFDKEGMALWEAREGWDAKEANKAYPDQVKSGAVQMVFERVVEVSEVATKSETDKKSAAFNRPVNVVLGRIDPRVMEARLSAARAALHTFYRNTPRLALSPDGGKVMNGFNAVLDLIEARVDAGPYAALLDLLTNRINALRRYAESNDDIRDLRRELLKVFSPLTDAEEKTAEKVIKDALGDAFPVLITPILPGGLKSAGYVAISWGYQEMIGVSTIAAAMGENIPQKFMQTVHHEVAHSVLTRIERQYGIEVVKKLAQAARAPHVVKQVLDSAINDFQRQYYLSNPEEMLVQAYGLWATGNLKLNADSVLSQFFSRLKEVTKTILGMLSGDKLLAETFAAIQRGEFKDLDNPTGPEMMESTKRRAAAGLVNYEVGDKLSAKVSDSAEAARRQFLGVIRKLGGVTTKEAEDITGEKGFKANQAGNIFRKDGKALDLIAERLHELGYMTDAEYESTDGGVEKVRDLIRMALDKQTVAPIAEQGKIESDRLAKEEEKKAQDAEDAQNDPTSKVMEPAPTPPEPPKPPTPPAGGSSGEPPNPAPQIAQRLKDQIAKMFGKTVRIGIASEDNVKEQPAGTNAWYAGRRELNQYKANVAKLKEVREQRRQALSEKNAVEVARLEKLEEKLLENTQVLGLIYMSPRLAEREHETHMYHEAIHAAFDILLSPEERAILATAFTKGTVARRLKEIFKDQPEVLAHMESAEEAAAYGFQIFATAPEQLQLGPNVKAIFEKVAKFFRELFDLMTTEEKAQLIMNDVLSGRRYERGMTPLQKVLEKDMTVPQKMQKLSRTFGSLVKAGWDILAKSSYERVLAFDNPALAKIAQAGYSKTGSEGELGYVHAQRAAETRYINYLDKAFGGFTEAEIKAGAEARIFGQVPTEPRALAAYNKLGEFFRMMHEYGTKAYPKDAENKLGFEKDYFPMGWDAEKVMNNRADFLAMLAKPEYEEHMSKLKVTPNELWETISNYVTRGETFQDVLGVNTNEPVNQFAKERTLGFIKPEDRRAFMNDNHIATLIDYTKQMTRQAEYVRAYGAKGEKLDEWLDEAKKKYGATPEQIALTKDYVSGLLGDKGIGMSRAQKDLYGALIVYQNFRLLPFSIFSSLVDPLGIAVRSNDLSAAAETFLYNVKNIFRDLKKDRAFESKDKWEKIAQDWGIIEESGTMSNLNNMYNTLDTRGMTRKLQDALFKYNLLNGWERNTKIMATKAAERFMVRAKEDFFGDNNERYLKELGLKKSDLVVKPDGSLAMTKEDLIAQGVLETQAEQIEKHLQDATVKFVNQAVLNPTAGDLPNWGSNPYFAPVFHLKQFMFTFQSTILRRIVDEAKMGNYKPLLASTIYVPGMIGADAIRGFVQNFGDEPPWKKNWGPVDYLLNGVDRSGLTGTGALLTGIKEDMMHGGTGFESLMAPSLEQLKKGIVAMEGGSAAKVNFMVKSLPLNPVYASAVLPD